MRKILGIPLTFFVIGLVIIGGATAALLTYYGTITANVNVWQSILLDGKDVNTGSLSITDTISHPAPGGETFCFDHNLKNQMSITGEVDLQTSCSPDCDGITVSCKQPADVSFDANVGSQPVNIKVEDIGACDIKWTFDFPGVAPYDGAEGDGSFAVALVIAKDGIGNGPAFQIHNNDGSDSNFAWGTWLYSPWGPTTSVGWNGWHSGSDNTLVSGLGWVSATGGRYNSENPDGLFTITIDKCELGVDDIHWAAYTAIGTGFNSGYLTYQQAYYPSTFNWGDPIVDGTDYDKLTFATACPDPFSIASGATAPFSLCYAFAQNIYPGTYTITTNAVPVLS